MSGRIAFLGLGAMGSRMATRLVEAGHEVTVWSRSLGSVQALMARGAKSAPTPRRAAQGADFVISMVRDDQAARQVWCHPDTGAFAAMHPDAIGIESATLSLQATQGLHLEAKAAGVALLDAPVSGSRPAAQAGELRFLVGGDAEAFRLARPILLAMGSATHHVGPAGNGALAKLVTNTLLGIHVASFAELIGLLRRQGIDAQALMAAVATTSVWAPVDHYLAGSMLSGEFAPQFPVELMAKDFNYTLAANAEEGAMPITASALAVYRRAEAQSLGAQNMTAVARLYAPSQF